MKKVHEQYRMGHIGADMNPSQDADPEIGPTIIDLGSHRAGKLDKLSEGGYYARFGAKIANLMQAMFGGTYADYKIRGTQQEIAAFMGALSKEKKYLELMRDFGFDDPRIYRQKSALDSAINKFERVTGLKWPFK